MLEDAPPPHLHRTRSLPEAMPLPNREVLSATPCTFDLFSRGEFLIEIFPEWLWKSSVAVCNPKSRHFLSQNILCHQLSIPRHAFSINTMIISNDNVLPMLNANSPSRTSARCSRTGDGMYNKFHADGRTDTSL